MSLHEMQSRYFTRHTYTLLHPLNQLDMHSSFADHKPRSIRPRRPRLSQLQCALRWEGGPHSAAREGECGCTLFVAELIRSDASLHKASAKSASQTTDTACGKGAHCKASLRCTSCAGGLCPKDPRTKPPTRASPSHNRAQGLERLRSLMRTCAEMRSLSAAPRRHTSTPSAANRHTLCRLRDSW